MKCFCFWAAFILCHAALGHPADQSDMRVRPKPHQLEIRFTFNILTLSRFVGIDADGDAKISMAELTAAQPRIAEYLNQHVHIEINQQKASLGAGVRFEALWPEPEKTPPMTEPDYSGRKMDVTFIQVIYGKRLEDFWLGFEIFEQTGPMQTIRGVFEQDGRVEEVPFSVQEPEYLYDTGYADDPFEQEADKKAAKADMPDSASGSGSSPAPPEALASTSAAVPAASMSTAGSSASMPGAGPAAGPGSVKPSAAVAAALEAAAAEATGEKRWWMTRAVVLMILLVVGRKMQLSARSRIVSTRRRPRPRS
ncbi:hypothetical protein [Prosthecobacter sp.]|uniref:hypothetical protein n=1 Tax=Prosthecobacter sp. TaxID=1965333 RepID=UPI003783C6F1